MPECSKSAVQTSPPIIRPYNPILVEIRWRFLQSRTGYLVRGETGLFLSLTCPPSSAVPSTISQPARWLAGVRLSFSGVVTTCFATSCLLRPVTLAFFQAVLCNRPSLQTETKAICPREVTCLRQFTVLVESPHNGLL